jgi:PAS domain S-box-containing protein
MTSIEGQTGPLAREQAARITAEEAQRRLAFLAEASDLLASSLDYEATLASLARLAVPFLADWCTVHILDEKGVLQQLAVEHVDPTKITWAHELQRRYPPDPDSPSGLHSVVLTGRSQLVPEITDQMLTSAARDDEELRLLRQIGFSSAMIVPLQARDRTLGAISFISAESGYHYDSADLAVAEDLARRAGIAVDNALLYREAQLAREALRIRARQQATVARLGQRALAGVDLSAFMQEAVSATAATLDIEYCTLLELLPERDSLLFRAGTGWEEGIVGSLVIGRGADNQAGYTLMVNQPVVVDDTAAESRFPLHPLVVSHGVVSTMSVIVHGQSRPFGVLGVQTTQKRHFSNDDVNFLQSVANVLGEAIERKQVEEEIRISEMRFRTMIEQSPLSIQIFSPTGDHLQANHAWEQLWGTTRDALAGYNILADRQLADKGVMSYIERGFAGEPTTLPPVMYDPEEIGREGRPRWVRAFIYPVRGSDGRIHEVVLVLEDVSTQIQVEEDLQRSRDQLKVILDGVADGITAQDHDGRLIYANDAAARISGFASAEKLLATPFSKIMGRFEMIDQNGDPFPVDALPGRRALHGELDAEELIGFRIDGEERWSIVKATPVFDKQGKVQLAINIFRDITERRHAEEEMKFQAHLLDVVEQGVIATDLRGRIIYWNRYAEELYGWSCSDVMGRNILEVVPAAPARDTAAQIMDRLRNGESWSGEIDVRRRDGSTFTSMVTDSPVYDRNGTMIGIIGISTDITRWKQAELELKQAKEMAEAADRAKGQFLAVLSHELRTPLTPVMTIVESLETDPRLSPELRPGVEMLRRNVELEARLIDDLLDLTRIAKGKLQLTLDTVDAHVLLRDVIDICHDDIRSKDLMLVVDLQSPHHHVRADSARLHQVFWNLIKNAVKFTPDGGHILIATRNDSADELIVEVSDNGIGIEPDMLVRIFDAFEQGEQTVTRRFGGLGLGLAISKTLIDMHGGRLLARSEGKDRGATFTVELATIQPTRPMTNGTAPEQTPVSKQMTTRILIVDDHADTSLVMKLMLERRGYIVITADSVRSALNAAASEQFDLLISDIGLPDGSGLELVRQVKAEQPMPAIALSGFGMDEDLRKSKEAGFSAHLIKPVNFQKLQEVIQKLISGEEPSTQ